MLYQDAVVLQLNRINDLGIEAALNLTKDAVMAYETAVRDLHYMLYPTYTSNEYEKKIKEIEEELDINMLAGEKLIRMNYLQKLQEWKGWLIKEFSQVDILPASKKDQDFPGYENIEDEKND